MISNKQPTCPSLSRHILTTRRCYCILSRLPFFELHFGILNSIFTEERLDRLMKGIGDLDLETFEGYINEEHSDASSRDHGDSGDTITGTAERSLEDSTTQRVINDGSNIEDQKFEAEFHLSKKGCKDRAVAPIDHEPEMVAARRESSGTNLEDDIDDFSTNKQGIERRLPNAVLPLLRYYQYESSESCSRYATEIL
ncbi:uncharacterized protein LOC110817641 [Carica papaya]|uniref:uncharacterized protein LOC110817641 n=1 Tax=Carica papaya TaxID=3649 RepID=UPI000B8CCCD2|nr:uncharacterized protein LOC110817641 [Carica papaya]